MAKWQFHISLPPPSTCSPSCKVMNCWQGIKGGVVPTVHHARHYLLAHMNLGTGTVPKRPQACTMGTRCQVAEVNMSVFVSV